MFQIIFKADVCSQKMLWFCRKISVKPEASQQNFVSDHDCAFFFTFCFACFYFLETFYIHYIYSQLIFFLACKCGIEKTKRIVGGTEVNPVRPYNFLLLNQLSIIFSSKVNKYPWMVRLSVEFGNGYGSYCGGTLVASRYVITAAHCVEFKEIEVTPDMITVWHISNLFLQNKDIEIV